MNATVLDPKCSNPVEATIEANMFGHDLLGDLFDAPSGKDFRPLWTFLRGLDVATLRRIWTSAVRELGVKTRVALHTVQSDAADPAGMTAELLSFLWCERRVSLRSGRMEFVRAWTSGGSDRWVPLDLISYRESRAALERVFAAAEVTP